VVEDIKAGEIFTENNVRSIRPGYGMHTKHWEEILGQRADRDLKKGTPLKWDMIKTSTI
jgi:sialic acid synthase SpsE